MRMKIFGLATPILQCLLEGSPRSALPRLSDFASLPVTQRMHRTTWGEKMAWEAAWGGGKTQPMARAPADLWLSSLGAQAWHTAPRGSSEPALNKHSSENGVLCPGKATKLTQGHVLPLLPLPAAPGKLLGEMGQMQPAVQVVLFGDPDGWEMGGREILSTESQSTYCPEMLGPTALCLPLPTLRCLPVSGRNVPLVRRAGEQSQLASPFPRHWQGSCWSAQGGEFIWSLLLRDTELLTSWCMCAVLAIYFTFLFILIHSFKQVMRPTRKEEEEGALLTWEELEEKQGKAAGGFTRKGPWKDDDFTLPC